MQTSANAHNHVERRTQIPTVVQHRHVHLSRADQDALFGAGVELTPMRTIGQRGQIVYEETVTVVGKHGAIEHVRIIGPARERTQLEVSATEAFALGINAPLRVSGDLGRSAPCRLRGPAGEVRLSSGTIIPARHLHCDDATAQHLGVAHQQVVTVTIPGRDGWRIEHVTVRVHPTYRLEFHITTDEAAQWWLDSGDAVVLE